MPVIYVARSQALQKWGAEVGLGKHVYKLGIGEGKAAEIEARLNADRVAGQTDWKMVKLQKLEDAIEEEQAVARLSAREKPIDPNFYPKLRGARGIFKIKLENVGNSLLVQQALGTGEMKIEKVKPADVAVYLIRNAVE
ncbi:MAG: hypothetical protein IT562_12395 [Alphaproteobacteria bacterium]|nr:hypothetical protein [Alphaproteobacteria bacterium]